MNGTDVLILLPISDGAGGTLYEPLASQRDASLEESNDTIDRSSKDARERRVRAGRYEASLSLEALYVPSDDKYAALNAALRDGTTLVVRVQESGAATEEADAIVTSLSKEFPDQDEATVSAEFAIDGAWRTVA